MNYQFQSQRRRSPRVRVISNENGKVKQVFASNRGWDIRLIDSLVLNQISPYATLYYEECANFQNDNENLKCLEWVDVTDTDNCRDFQEYLEKKIVEKEQQLRGEGESRTVDESSFGKTKNKPINVRVVMTTKSGLGPYYWEGSSFDVGELEKSKFVIGAFYNLNTNKWEVANDIRYFRKNNTGDFIEVPAPSEFDRALRERIKSELSRPLREKLS